MPDQDTTPEPPKRMTTAEAAKMAQEAAQNASAALRVAQGADDMVAAVSEQVTDLGQRVRDRETAHAELRDEMMQRFAGVGPAAAGLVDADGKPVVTRDQVDSRIHEALEPLHQEVHELRQKGTLTAESKGSLAGVLARLEDAEHKLAAVTDGGVVTRVVQEIHPLLFGLRSRLDAAEEALKSQVDPASHTLAEDALSDQLEHMVDRKLAAMFEAAGLTPARLAGLADEVTTLRDGMEMRFTQMARDVQDIRQHVETHGTHVTRATIDQMIRQLEPATGTPPGGTGAATKVLELMRLVTHIGKEKEANLGKGGRFKFRGVDDAMDAVGHAMREVGLILSTEILGRETTLTPVTQQGTDNGKPWERTVVWATSVVTARYTFTDPADGSTHPFEMVGEGRDSSDKSTSKATSMALKYGLFQALMIPVTGLDDADDAPPQTMVDSRTPTSGPAPYGSLPGDVTGRERASEQQPSDAEQAQVRARRAGEALAAIKNVHRVQGGHQAQHDRLVQIMTRVKEEGLLEFQVEGSTLNQHGLAAMQTLKPAPAEPEYQPSQQELRRAVQDLPHGSYPPDQDGSNYGEAGGY